MEKNKYSEQDWKQVTLTKIHQKKISSEKQIPVNWLEKDEIPKKSKINDTFRQRIMASRFKLKIGQVAFAKTLSIDAKELARWEKGEGKPSEKQYVKLNKYMNKIGV